jgi:hypothetical protein
MLCACAGFRFSKTVVLAIGGRLTLSVEEVYWGWMTPSPRGVL